MAFGWHIVFFCVLRFREMNVPRPLPPVAILSFFVPFVGNAVSNFVACFGSTVRVCASEVSFVRIGFAWAFG